MLAQALRLNLHVLVFQYLPGLSKDSMCEITCFYWFYYNWYLFKHGLEVKKKREKKKCNNNCSAICRHNQVEESGYRLLQW